MHSKKILFTVAKNGLGGLEDGLGMLEELPQGKASYTRTQTQSIQGFTTMRP